MPTYCCGDWGVCGDKVGVGVVLSCRQPWIDFIRLFGHLYRTTYSIAKLPQFEDSGSMRA